AGNAAIRRLAAAMVLVVGLLASRSRGGLLGFGLSLLALPVAVRGRGRTVVALALIAVVLLGVYWIDLGPTRQAFESRGIRNSRVVLWQDALRLFPHFPALASGFDAFGTAYPYYQTLPRYDWYGEAHNEYLQVLLDTGLAGAALMAGLLFILLRSALRAATETPLDAGILAGVLACCFHNVVDFNW